MGMAVEKKVLYGFDIGTQGSKGIIIDEDGHLLAYHYVKHEVLHPWPGWAEHDAEAVWWEEFRSVTKVLLKKSGIDPRKIHAIGCSAISPCMLPVDEAGKPLRNAILYGIDTRTTSEIAELNRIIGKEKIISVGKVELSSQAVGPKILWYKQHEPALFARTYKFLTASSYLTFRLTGAYTMDYCNAVGYNPLFNCDKRVWDGEMCRAVGVDVEQLPTLMPSYQIAGYVNDAAAKETGLSPDTVVIAGTGDFAAELLSTGAEKGDTILVYGSTMLIQNLSGADDFRPGLFLSPFPLMDLYLTGGSTATAASITKWFRDQLGQPELEAEQNGDENAYDLLASLAATSPPGSNGLVVLPYFSGERTPLMDENARGMIFGLTLGHTRADLYRAVLEGVAYSVRHNVEVMRESGLDITGFVSTGGGVKNRMWIQIVSDVTGLAQRCLLLTGGSPAGCAYLAGYGSGLFNGMSELRSKWITQEQLVEPDLQNTEKYNRLFEIYKELYLCTKKQMHQIADMQAMG